MNCLLFMEFLVFLVQMDELNKKTEAAERRADKAEDRVSCFLSVLTRVWILYRAMNFLYYFHIRPLPLWLWHEIRKIIKGIIG